MIKTSNKRKVNKALIKIHDSSASDAADPYSGSDHVGGRDAGGGPVRGGGVFATHLACSEGFFLNEVSSTGFSFSVLVGIEGA